MNALPQLSFNTQDVASRLLGMSDTDLDRVPFGVVEMDLDFRVLRYNAAESRYSGLPPARVVGRHFFLEVAPCADTPTVAGRYGRDGLDETLSYTFSLRMRPTAVTLRLLRPPGSQRMYLLVLWT